MINLLLLIVTVGLTLGLIIFHRPTSLSGKLAFIALYCLSLGLALRFGGRTYPGIYFPRSPSLNSLLNGNLLFTQIGYGAVLIAAFADSWRVLGTSSGQRLNVGLQVVKWIAVTLAVIIAIFGFWIAVVLQRLPNG